MTKEEITSKKDITTSKEIFSSSKKSPQQKDELDPEIENLQKRLNEMEREKAKLSETLEEKKRQRRKRGYDKLEVKASEKQLNKALNKELPSTPQSVKTLEIQSDAPSINQSKVETSSYQGGTSAYEKIAEKSNAEQSMSQTEAKQPQVMKARHPQHPGTQIQTISNYMPQYPVQQLYNEAGQPVFQEGRPIHPSHYQPTQTYQSVNPSMVKSMQPQISSVPMGTSYGYSYSHPVPGSPYYNMGVYPPRTPSHHISMPVHSQVQYHDQAMDRGYRENIQEPNSFCAQTADFQTSIQLIEGFIYDSMGVQPGGKRNSSKDVLPRQVIELRGRYLPTYQCTVSVMGYNKRSSSMITLGVMDRQNFTQTSNGQYLAVFSNCCCKYSSHSYGQRLCLQFSLVDGTKTLCSINSKFFQTITRRGREKRVKRLSQQNPHWTPEMLSKLAKGVEKFGSHAISCFESILVHFKFEAWITPQMLQSKYEELQQPSQGHSPSALVQALPQSLSQPPQSSYQPPYQSPPHQHPHTHPHQPPVQSSPSHYYPYSSHNIVHHQHLQ